MRYDQYYLVHRLIENLSGGEEEEEGILEVMVTSVLRNGCDKKCGYIQSIAESQGSNIFLNLQI